MNNHITSEEMKEYFDIISSGKLSEDNQDFIDEMDAHVAECEDCCEKMKAVRVLLRGFSKNPSAARRFVNACRPQSTAVPVFNLRAAFRGVKGVVADKLRILADTLSENMNATFIPDRHAMALARGDKYEVMEDEINNILFSDMKIEMEGGRTVIIRCRSIRDDENVTLFVYTNFKVSFRVSSEGRDIPLEREEYDELIDEYVYSYNIGNGGFELTV